MRLAPPSVPLLVAALLAVPLTAAPAVAAPSAPPGQDTSLRSRPTTGTYTNPLTPDIGDGRVLESCADPMVLRAQEPEDPYWYMYCTTDPLDDEDRDASGALVFNKIPQLRSLDLVDWEYLGNAFTENPSWATPTAGLWAPDVVYSSTFDQYYMFVTVTDTLPSVSGVELNAEGGPCDSDSALGVATSPSPTGPWTFSDTPVVAPRQNPASPGACDFFWTYDADVLGDTVTTESPFYYGSYYGGIFAGPATFTEDGVTIDAASTEQVTIGNRYEGANVVEKDGYFYLFASATNCCNGALTGYSVFVGRSEDPYGPFVDREGVSLLDSRVGGTPFLTMNGNRWVGTGHNSVFQDAAGQWWTAYHAVDQEDPFFEGAPGFTKRPVLLDPVDWVDGWPTVRGGLWASDTRMPAPAAQEGDRSRYRTRLAAPQEPGRLLLEETFDSGLDGWTWVREPDPATYEVTGGELAWQVQDADLYVTNNSASVLTTEAPRGDYVVQTKVSVDVPEGCCFNYAQAGLVVYGDDDNFIKLTEASIWETRQTEFAKEINPVPVGWSRYGNTVVGPPGEPWTYLRIVVEQLSGKAQREAGGDTERYTAYTSRDGVTWVRGGVWTHSLGEDARIGLVSMGGPGAYPVQFDEVLVSSLRTGRSAR